MASTLPTSFISIEAENTDTIHARMLDTAKQYDPDVDVQEGSPVWDANRPSAEELENIQINIVNAVSAVIPATSWGDYLDDHVTEAGITRKPGDYATGTVDLKATVDVTVPAGTVLATISGLEFVTDAEAVITPPAVQPDPDNPEPGVATVNVTATAVGRDYNISPYTLRLVPREFENLVILEQAQAFTGGLDAESDDDLRARYFAVIRNRSGAGNPDNYKGWALEVNGTKAAKVFRATPSPGSVTIAVASQEGVPDAELVDEVQARINAHANVLSNNIVVPATALPIDMSGTLTLMPDTLLADVQTAFEDSVVSYLESLYYTGEPVRYSAVYQLLLNTTGVLDVSDFIMNGAVANILAEGTDIAVLGKVTFT